MFTESLISRYATDCWGAGGHSDSQHVSAPPSDLTRVLKVCLTSPHLTWPELYTWQVWAMQWDLIDCSVPTVLLPWTWTAWCRCAWRRRAWAPGSPSPATPHSTQQSSGGLATRPGFTRTKNGIMKSTFTRWHLSTFYTPSATQLAEMMIWEYMICR